MKRREYGVNLDDGVALSTEEEFRLLYVRCNPDESACLQGWFADNAQVSLMLGGQIGSGKTTILNEVSRSFPGTQIINICFDTDPIEQSEGCYTMFLLGRILQTCLNAGVDSGGCGIGLSDFPSIDADSWHSFADKIVSRPSTLKQAERLLEAGTVIGKNSKLVRNACGQLLDRLQGITSRKPIIIAEGIDKFRPGTSEYFSIQDTLSFLSQRKTLFEVNAIHLFKEQDFRPGIRKLFIGGIADDMLVQMFQKRLGSYAPIYQDAFSLLSKYSGGNARQALRLLNAYYFRRTQHKNDHAAAIALACHQVRKDLLGVAYGRFPTEIFTVVKHDKYIEGSLFQDPKVSEGANDALYHNWLFIQSEPNLATPTRWPCVINPLIDEAIKWKADAPRTPEEEAVRKWASDHDISPLGLNLPVDDDGKPAWDKFWEEIEASSFSDRNALNILGLIDEIGAGLFGIERQDRIIITYKDRKNLEAVRDFLVGEANTYSYFPCEEMILEGGEGRSPVTELLVWLADPDPNRIYSVELIGKWTDAQLRDLEHRRDIFDNLQMLWWIQLDNLKHYLRFWPQLRQFFRIYRLEDELLRGITMEEIQADIDLIKEMSEEDDPEGVHRLQNVLVYLKEAGGKS